MPIGCPEHPDESARHPGFVDTRLVGQGRGAAPAVRRRARYSADVRPRGTARVVAAWASPVCRTGALGRDDAIGGIGRAPAILVDGERVWHGDAPFAKAEALASKGGGTG